MQLRQRLKALEKRAQRYVQQTQTPQNVRYDDEGWLHIFEEHGRQGYCDQEPEFPTLLAAYRRALEEAIKEPLFEPPESYEPQLPLAERRMNWREKHRTAAMEAVWAAWEQLAEIVRRTCP